MRRYGKSQCLSNLFYKTLHLLEISFHLVSPELENKLRTPSSWRRSQSSSCWLTSCPFLNILVCIVCNIFGCHSRAVASPHRTCSTRHSKCRSSYWFSRQDLALLNNLHFAAPIWENLLAISAEATILLHLYSEELFDTPLCIRDWNLRYRIWSESWVKMRQVLI